MCELLLQIFSALRDPGRILNGGEHGTDDIRHGSVFGDQPSRCDLRGSVHVRRINDGAAFRMAEEHPRQALRPGSACHYGIDYCEMWLDCLENGQACLISIGGEDSGPGVRQSSFDTIGIFPLIDNDDDHAFERRRRIAHDIQSCFSATGYRGHHISFRLRQQRIAMKSLIDRI